MQLRIGRRAGSTIAGGLILVLGLAVAAFAFATAPADQPTPTTIAWEQWGRGEPGAGGNPAATAAAPPVRPSVTGRSTTSTAVTTTSLVPATRFDTLNWAGKPAGDGILVYDGFPPEGKVIQRLANTGQFGEETVVRILRETTDRRGSRWYQALLPVRPNETKGWIRADDVIVFAREHRILIDLSDHRLDLFRGDDLVGSFPVAVGKAGTPTPTGEFFVTVRVKPPNPGGAYGPLALGLSAFSEVLTDWPGGGQAAIHGTNNPALIGTDASHGCVRMRNADILRVGEAAFVGTPVRIVP